MTETRFFKNKRSIFPFLFAIFCFLAVFLFPSEVSNGIRRALSLAYQSLVPALFPFMILSDLLLSIDWRFFDQIIGTRIGKLFGVSPIAARVIIIGCLSGFPIGAKLCADLYRQGKLSESEAQTTLHLASFCSPAFIIMGIGRGVLDSASLGTKIYWIILFSHLLSGLIFRRSRKHSAETSRAYDRQTSFSLTESIEKAGLGCMKITAYLAFFSAVSSIISGFIKNNAIASVFAILFEIGSGASFIDANSRYATIILCGGIAFSGLSVAMQITSYAKQVGISMKTYYLGKILSCIFAAFFAHVFLT